MQEAGTPAPGPVRRGLARLLVRGADAGLRLLGGTHVTGRERITEAQLRDLIAANTVLRGEERRLIAEVLAAGARHVREGMVPRPGLSLRAAGQRFGEARRLSRAASHSRFPIMDGSQDDVVGF